MASVVVHRSPPIYEKSSWRQPSMTGPNHRDGGIEDGGEVDAAVVGPRS